MGSAYASEANCIRVPAGSILGMVSDDVVVLQGSHRRNGDTHVLVDCVFQDAPIAQFRLIDCRIEPYTYDRHAIDDDFRYIAEAMVKARSLVFATPVYWYAMSGLTKTVLDRFTDLTSFRKDLGRSLQGKVVHVLACGTDLELPSGFTVPFSQTAAYFDMTFGGTFYAQADGDRGFSDDTKQSAQAFGAWLLGTNR